MVAENPGGASGGEPDTSREAGPATPSDEPDTSDGRSAEPDDVLDPPGATAELPDAFPDAPNAPSDRAAIRVAMLASSPANGSGDPAAGSPSRRRSSRVRDTKRLDMRCRLRSSVIGSRRTCLCTLAVEGARESTSFSERSPLSSRHAHQLPATRRPRLVVARSSPKARRVICRCTAVRSTAVRSTAVSKALTAR